MPDLAGEVPFEAAERFQFGLSFGLFALDVGAGVGVPGDSPQRDDVDRPVELAVTAAVQSVADRFAGVGRDRGGAGVPGEARVGWEPFGAGGVADDVAAVIGPQPCSFSSAGHWALISAVSSERSSRSSRVIWPIRLRISFATRTCGL